MKIKFPENIQITSFNFSIIHIANNTDIKHNESQSSNNNYTEELLGVYKLKYFEDTNEDEAAKDLEINKWRKDYFDFLEKKAVDPNKNEIFSTNI
jgi:hypothetical protein